MLRACEVFGPCDGLTLFGCVSVGISAELDIGFGCFKALDRHGSTAQSKGGFHRFSEALLSISRATKSVNSDVDVVAEILVEGWWFFERRFMPVDTPVQVALFHQLSEQFHMRPLSGTNDRRPNGDTVRLHSPENVIHDFLYGSSGDLFSAGWTVRFSNSRPKKTEVILDFCDGCHGRPRVVAALFLIDGNRRRKSLDGVAICFFHLSNELTRIRRQALDVPPLTFGVQCVKGKARFS